MRTWKVNWQRWWWPALWRSGRALAEENRRLRGMLGLREELRRWEEADEPTLEWVKRALGGMPESVDWWRAVMWLLEHKYKRMEVDWCARGDLSAEQRAYNAGRLAMVMDVQRDLLRRAAKGDGEGGNSQ